MSWGRAALQARRWRQRVTARQQVAVQRAPVVWRRLTGGEQRSSGGGKDNCVWLQSCCEVQLD